VESEVFQKIEKNDSPKSSTQIVVSDNSTKINTIFEPIELASIELDKTNQVG